MPVRDIANFSSARETFAPATLAPLESCTAMRSEPLGFWACAASGKRAMAATPRKEMAIRRVRLGARLCMDPDPVASPFYNRVRIAVRLVNRVGEKKYGGQADARVTRRWSHSAAKPGHPISSQHTRLPMRRGAGLAGFRIEVAKRTPLLPGDKVGGLRTKKAS